MAPHCPQHRANHLPFWAVAHPLGHFCLTREARGSWSHLLQASSSEPSLPWPGLPLLFSATFQNYLSAPFLKPHSTLTPQAAGASQQWRWWACPPPLQEQAGAGGCVHRAPGYPGTPEKETCPIYKFRRKNWMCRALLCPLGFL